MTVEERIKKVEARLNRIERQSWYDVLRIADKFVGEQREVQEEIKALQTEKDKGKKDK